MCKIPDEEYNWVTCAICNDRLGLRKPCGNEMRDLIREVYSYGWHVLVGGPIQFSCKKCGGTPYATK